MSFDLTFKQMRDTTLGYLNALLEEPNLNNVEECLSEDFKGCFNVYCGEKKEYTENNKITFIKALAKGHFENIVQIDAKYDIIDNNFSFKQVKDNQLISKISSTQNRLGMGALEDGPGWYRLSSKIEVSFCFENNTLKISKINDLGYKKEKI